ncbi:MAG: hypothetical protein K5874_01940 [Bacteroidaceae bacterium]|nr:hypothetical protein [Bacteroidaceae bacterium]
MAIEKATWIRTLKATIGITALIVGGLLYVIFRSKSLLMFEWFRMIGLSDMVENLRTKNSGFNLYEWVKDSLPAGLWLFSYLFVIDSLWGYDKNLVYYLFLSVLPAIAICSEFMQFSGMLSGTFDYMDLISYMAAILIFILIK